ncbi:MAG: homocysteine S-methyltransferase family protein, partial [Solirubrobacteraceae bacterium]
MSDTEAAPAYARIGDMIAAGRCVILDGGIGTELPQAAGSERALDEPLWGARALIDAPDAVLRVHARYLEAGCDVITTNTWGLATALSGHGPGLWDDIEAPVHWMDVARRAVRLAHRAVDEADLQSAVAFSLNADVNSEGGRETVRLLARLFADEPRPPDLILLETLSVLDDSLEPTVQALLETGLPVWLSFRRCRHGLCGVYGQHWGGPEGDAFGRAARRFEGTGVGALLINCIPPDHAAGMVAYLRDFTDLPLGVYPNLGYFTDRGWRFDAGVGGEEYAAMALRWREEGAQIIGGCCGVRPEHIAAARARLKGTRPGHTHPAELAEGRNGGFATSLQAAPPPPWSDRRGRTLFPLPFPELTVEPGVFVPAQPSHMTWRYLFREGVGAHQRCLDVGCGTGLLGIQLALNGAAHVLAVDIDQRAVANTLGNAFRNGVSDRLTAQVVDLYPWVPDERYECIVSCLYQRPTDPFREAASHRWGDYWGRNVLDQLIGKLPEALAPEGVAYVVQFSIASQQRTAELLAGNGLVASVVDYTLFEFPPGFEDSAEQFGRVEQLSDAYHVRLGEHPLMVA